MWSYKKPVDAGWYHCSYGDLVTDDNYDCIRLVVAADGVLRDKDQVNINEYNESFKFMPVGISSLNQIRNID